MPDEKENRDAHWSGDHLQVVHRSGFDLAEHLKEPEAEDDMVTPDKLGKEEKK